MMYMKKQIPNKMRYWKNFSQNWVPKASFHVESKDQQNDKFESLVRFR